MAVEDNWPMMPDGTDYDGKNLLALVRSERSPFDKDWDVKLLIHEIEKVADAQIIDIPAIKKGSNHYMCFLCLTSTLPLPTLFPDKSVHTRGPS
jgi:hypothetical protein